MFKIFETNLIDNSFNELFIRFSSHEQAVAYLSVEAWKRHVTIDEGDRMVIKEIAGTGKQYELQWNKARIVRWDIVET